METHFTKLRWLAVVGAVMLLPVTGACTRAGTHPGGSSGAVHALAGGRASARSEHAANRDRPAPSEEPAREHADDPPQPLIDVGPELDAARADLPDASRRVDPGAAVLVETLRKSIGVDELATRDVEIAVRPLRNQSRATADELRILRSRLLALISPATEGRSVRIVEEETPQTEYTLGGSVYLIERSGEEFWELYLALRPVGANWRIWKNADPVRLEREKKMAGDDRIEYGGTP